MKVGLLGALRVEHDGRLVHVTGVMQRAVLFRLAVDAGTSVSYRAMAEDIWALDAPENSRAALQSIVSRLRAQLPADTIISTQGGYRLSIARADVDALAFEDLVAAASAAGSAADAAAIASDALALWTGEPWIPSDSFDWFIADLERDRRRAIELGGVAGRREQSSSIAAPITGLIGREHELATITDQLARARLVTIIGTGGAGKTRLAVETARSWPGALLVELAPAGPDEVLAAVLASTGRDIRTSESAAEPASTTDRIIDALLGRDVLLVLDNCEHVIDAAARAAATLLAHLPRLRILATSREPLGVPGEAFVPVGPLEQPDAVQLFAERAAAASGAELDAAQLETAAQICERLDGLALAIELAAAKLRTMTTDEVLAGLDDRFSLLTGGFRTALPRHRTLKAMIDWSWSLLDGDEQLVLSRFSVFPAGVDVRDAPALATTLGSRSTDVFDSLVDRSLLQRTNHRYRALETVREYGVERLSEQGELANARTAQVDYVLARAQATDKDLRGPRIYDALAWFDAEEDNIAAALRFAAKAGLGQQAVDLILSGFWYWTIRDRMSDASVWITAVAPLAVDLDSTAARLISFMAPLVVAMSGSQGGEPDDEIVEELMPDVPEFELAGNDQEVLQLATVVLRAFADAASSPGWMTRVEVPRGEELGLAPWPTAVLNVVRAALAQNKGDIEGLGVSSELAVAQFEEIGDLWGLALSQQMRSEWLAAMGDLDGAFELGELSTVNMRKITSSWDLAQQQGLAVSILVRQGRVDEARSRLTRLLDEAEASGKVGAIAQVLITAVAAYIQMGDREAARAAMTRFDELEETLPSRPGQLTAWAESGRAGIAILDGDTAAAERHLRKAAERAIATHDHPIIGSVALGLAGLALANGDIPRALQAVDLSTAIVGHYDATNLQVIAIEAAARNAGIGRTGAAPTRPAAIESLQRLVSG